MKKPYTYLLCAVAMQLISTGITHAQETTLALKAPATAVTIDGVSKEWGDSLAYYNAETKINYTIANDKDNLYLVVRTNDLSKQNFILSSGITFSIDIKGRKKSAFSVTFPVGGQEVMRRTAITLEENKLRADLLGLRKIGVKGFKDIDEQEIVTSNTFGIQVNIGFDDKGYLIYEEAIPLNLFHAGDLAKGDWAFNIKLNPPSRPESNNMGSDISTAGLPGFASGGSRGGRGGGVARNPSPTASLASKYTVKEEKPIDFWGKLSLAK